VLIFFFGGYIFLILYVCTVSKKHLKAKKKNTFCLKIFSPTARERREGRGGQERKTKKEQYTHRINSNLPGESIAGERKRV